VNGKSLQSLAGIAVALAVAGTVAWAGSGGSARVGGMPLFAVCAGIAFVVQWVAFVPAYLRQTEHYYDLTGSLTYLGLVALALALGPRPDARSLLLGGLIAVWAVRLGTFLFRRVRRSGADTRFDDIKPDALRFAMTWTLQGLWVFLTASCALAAITSTTRVPLGAWGAIGAGVWLAGFALEVIADRQKSAFREDPANRDRFIDTGLWAWSRHPNYFGEIVLWAGIALLAWPALSGGQLVTLVSPVFVYVLLTRVSGVPMLEARAKKRWGDDPAFRAYKARTPVLVPRPPRAGS
jgi:steroid 5-alpha reductase family enzyme